MTAERPAGPPLGPAAAAPGAMVTPFEAAEPMPGASEVVAPRPALPSEGTPAAARPGPSGPRPQPEGEAAPAVGSRGADEGAEGGPPMQATRSVEGQQVLVEQPSRGDEVVLISARPPPAATQRAAVVGPAARPFGGLEAAAPRPEQEVVRVSPLLPGAGGEPVVAPSAPVAAEAAPPTKIAAPETEVAGQAVRRGERAETEPPLAEGLTEGQRAEEVGREARHEVELNRRRSEAEGEEQEEEAAAAGRERRAGAEREGERDRRLPGHSTEGGGGGTPRAGEEGGGARRGIGALLREVFTRSPRGAGRTAAEVVRGRGSRGGRGGLRARVRLAHAALNRV
jgi:hypothetical protein